MNRNHNTKRPAGAIVLRPVLLSCNLHTRNIKHDNKMTKASAHDKQMKNFMRAKIFMLCIEKGKLQCIDDAANGVDAVGREATKGTIARTHSQPMEM